VPFPLSLWRKNLQILQFHRLFSLVHFSGSKFGPGERGFPMKYAITLMGCLTFLSLAFSQTPKTPVITQQFVFACNSDYSSCPDGFDPTLNPIQIKNSLYGVTWWAGKNNSNAAGTVWSYGSKGMSVLYTFQPGSQGNFPDGANPTISFLQGSDGNLYGITEQGGTQNDGVFYKLSPSGFEVLHNFCSLPNCADASAPIILGADGNFYGVVGQTVFRLTPSGAWSSFFTFPTNDFGASLILGSDGNFYGSGLVKGTNLDAGIVFKLTPGGQFSIIYQLENFVGVSSNLVQASDGNFYGGTTGSGPGTGIFQLTPSGVFTIIYELSQAVGFSPNLLMQASDGNLWGLSIDGGNSPDRPGTILAVSTSGTLIASSEFDCTNTGCDPEGMIQASDGNFYGTAIKGGNAPGYNPEGTLFKVEAGLPPLR
jgi:uncharacterized repeat protein (TIGR03803 family)